MKLISIFTLDRSQVTIIYILSYSIQDYLNQYVDHGLGWNSSIFTDSQFDSDLEVYFYTFCRDTIDNATIFL